VTQANKPIAVTVSLVLVTVITVVLAATLLRFYSFNRDRYWADLGNGLEANADRAAIGLALPVWNIDRDQIDRVIESVMREDEVFAVVATAAGRTHAFVRDASWAPVPSSNPPLPAGLLRADRAVRMGTELIGSVSVFVTPRFVEEALRRWVIAAAAVILLVDVTLVVVLTLVLWRIVLKPLRTVERYAGAVSSGERPDATATLGGVRFRGEVEGLRKSIERMVSQLDGRYRELMASITDRDQAERAIHALAARLQVVREEEKSRIARDLHDELGQLLTGVKMDLRWVERRIGELAGSAHVNAILDHVVGASELVDQTVTSVQRIAADLRPSALDRLGLGAALRDEARRFQERSGIPCEVALQDGLPDLRDDAATALYRISQEALTNVARHAQASRVLVSLAVAGESLTLRVEDDGRGLDAAAVGPQALGLLGMRERATALGGDVTFTRGRERGTVATLRVPLARVVQPFLGAGT
jgi:signal transduction histidine kinase